MKKGQNLFLFFYFIFFCEEGTKPHAKLLALTSYQIMYMPYTAGRSTHVHVLDPQNRHFTKLDYRKRRKLKVFCQIIFVHLIKSTNIFVFEKWVISRDRHIQTKPQRIQNQ